MWSASYARNESKLVGQVLGGGVGNSEGPQAFPPPFFWPNGSRNGSLGFSKAKI